MSPAASSTIDRRTFLSAAGAALLPAARAQSTSDLKPVFSEAEKRHDVEFLYELAAARIGSIVKSCATVGLALGPVSFGGVRQRPTRFGDF